MSSPDPQVEPVLTAMTRWQKVRLVIKVVELRLRFIALMAATGLLFGYWDTIRNHYDKWMRPPGEVAAAAAGFEFYCPMHPNVVQADPSTCPICGMPLSKRKHGHVEPLPPGATARVALATDRVVQAGIRTREVSYRPLVETLTTVGTVTFDERRLARIASKARGMARVETLFVNVTGDPVEAGKPLAELYSPELYQAVQELLLARKSAAERPRMQSSLGRAALGDPEQLVRMAREKLTLWGLTDGQVDAILADGKAGPTQPILSPISGIVVKKNVVEGQYVAEGEAMFEVADLDRVWVQAQVFEDRLAMVRVGQTVEATVEAYPGEVFRGAVAFVDPVLDPATRTVRVRYDLDNAGHRLRPGMFATVTLSTPVAEIPAFKARLARVDGPQKNCPVTRLELGSMGEPVPIEVEGRKVLMCCAGCESRLKAEPKLYLARLSAPPRDAVLAVPESAVIDTGTRKVVYVETEPGVFEGRAVVLGPRSGDLYPVLEGLEPGERVAAAGAFLIDAESRLNPPPQAEPETEPGPAPEAKPETAPAPRTASAGPAGTAR